MGLSDSLRTSLARSAGLLLLLVALGGPASAQELEPRAYSPSPVGANFFVVAYAHQTGGVLVDAAVPIEDISVKLDSVSMLYGRTFSLAGRQASVAVALPYVMGDVSGTVFEERREITRSGTADVRVRLSANLYGGPAMTRREFAERKPTTTVGASLVVVAPTGQYDPAKLINLGSNRWSYKPEIGVAHPIGPWNFEVAGGVWFFTRNDDYFGGKRFEQKPLGIVHGYVSYTFRPGLWVAGGVNYFTGGRTVVDGVEKATLQRNSRTGVAVSLPIVRGQAVKLSWSQGLTTRFGGDLKNFSVAYQYTWFD